MIDTLTRAYLATLRPAAGFRWFRPLTRFVVVRGIGNAHEGRWYDRADIHPLVEAVPGVGAGPLGETAGMIELHATGRYEQRADGMVAEVFTPEGHRG